MKKKKLLLITTIYPAPDLKYGTKVLHYFTKEWVKMGYSVDVLHFQVVYPHFFYFIAKIFRGLIASITGAIVNTERQFTDVNYIIDGVNINRFPIFKKVPMGKFSITTLNEQITKIRDIYFSDKNYPFAVLGHFANPQLYIINELKKQFPDIKTSLTMHDGGTTIRNIFPDTDIMKGIDIWGFRSQSFKNQFENLHEGVVSNSFMCYSGIPSYYFNNINRRKFSSKLSKFIFIGDFIRLKNIISIINALYLSYPDKDFQLVLIGDGAEEGRIRRHASRLGIKENISLLGRLDRNDTIKPIDNSECFIMISSPEAFGLVYIEAMARGCLTIGSKNQGIDGVIKDGYNGFLCEPGNAEELSAIINNINVMSAEKRKEISDRAVETAKNMTDEKVALNYINEIESIQ
ncbi:MAG: glycosyltransferase [Dysgonomonas sp.]